jgi:quinol monooxygenase YgiN
MARENDMSSQARVAIWAYLQAKPGKEAELETFLKGALPLAEREPGTTSWFAIKINKSTFGIFDTFVDDSGRDAHLNGPIAKALMEKAGELLAKPPSIEKVDVVAAKLR